MIFKRNKKGVIFIYELDSTTNYRIDFSFGKLLIEDIIYEKLIHDFKTFQIIQSDSTFITPLNDLDKLRVKYWINNWTGNKKNGFDLIILPNEYLYRFIYGSYIYLILDSKNSIDKESLISWINLCFPDRFKDIDDLYAGQITDNFKLIDGFEFALITNYDSNRDIGIVTKKSNLDKIIDWIKVQLDNFEITNMSIEKYENCERTKTIK